VPTRVWVERLALVTPGPAATRWLLLGDLVCLILVGRAARWPSLGVAVAVGVGFVGLNLVSMAVRDFYLGLALFHLAVGVAAATLGPTRWAGLALVAVALVLGLVT
jgi:hypothetical protein